MFLVDQGHFMLSGDAGSNTAGRQPSAVSVTRILMNHHVWLTLWLSSLCFPGWSLAAEPLPGKQADPAGAMRAVDAEQPAVVPGKAAKPALTPLQKRKVVVLTTMMIAGILSVLLLLFLWIVWWSRRTHRLLREPLPAVHRGDELWYLKAKSSPAPATDQPTTEAPPAPPSA